MLKYHLLKAVEAFVFPPGIFILFLFLSSLFAKRFKKFFLFLTFISYLLTTQFTGNLLLQPLEKPYNKPFIHHDRVNLVVVLGGGYYKGSQNLPLSQSAFKRAVLGYQISKKEKLPLFYNGSGYESQCAKITYNQLYKNTKNIYFENRALSTKDNATLTKEFFDKKGIKNPKIYLITSAVHMTRAKNLFQKQGIKVIPVATDFRTSDSFCYCFFTPSSEGLSLNYLALHEYVAIFINKFNQPR